MTQQTPLTIFGLDLKSICKKVYEQHKELILSGCEFPNIRPKEEKLLNRLLQRNVYDLDIENQVRRIDQLCQARQQRKKQQCRYASENVGDRWTVKIQNREKRAKKRLQQTVIPVDFDLNNDKNEFKFWPIDGIIKE